MTEAALAVSVFILLLGFVTPLILAWKIWLDDYRGKRR